MRSAMPWLRPAGAPPSRSTQALILSATPTLSICWKPGRTYAAFNFCWVTAVYRPRPAICVWPRPQSALRPALWICCRCPSSIPNPRPLALPCGRPWKSPISCAPTAMSSAGRMRPLCPHGRSGRYAISRCAAPPRWAAIWNDVTSVATSVTHITRAGDRTCPKCQSLARAKWLEKRRAELLPVEYFHVVFTLPEPLTQLSLQNQRQMYDLLFRATAETLQTIAADPQHLGAQIGFFCILHSWGQTLTPHPHLHCVVPGGGMSLDPSRWVACRPGFFLPVKVLSRRFR